MLRVAFASIEDVLSTRRGMLVRYGIGGIEHRGKLVFSIASAGR